MTEDWDQACDRYLARLANQGRSPATLAAYAEDLADFGADLAAELAPELSGTVHLADVTADALDGALARYRTRPDRRYRHPPGDSRGRSTAAVARRVAAVRGLFAWAYETGRVQVDISRTLKTPRGGRTLPRLLDDDVAYALVEAAGTSRFPTRDRLIVAFGLACGMRRAEIAGLGLDGLVGRPPTRLLVRGKGNKDRTLGIPPLVSGLLGEYLPERERRLGAMHATARSVIISTRARPVHGLVVADATVETVAYAIDRALRTLGEREPGKLAHALRHTYATLALRDGVMNLRELQTSLGHASLGTTERYTHVIEDEVVAAMRAHPLGRAAPT